MLMWTRSIFEIGRLRVDLQFHTGDWWIGVYSDPWNAGVNRVRRWHVCLLPCFPIRVTWRKFSNGNC